jgi:hypothetical protein
MTRKNKNTTVRRRAIVETDDNIFVRSRTIRSQDLTADKKDHALLLKRQIEKKRQSRRRKVLAIVVGVLALFVLATLVMSQFIFSINSVHYNDTLAATNPVESKYIETANEYLAVHPPSRFSFSLREDVFSGFMSQQHPEILSANIAIRPFMPAELVVTLRRPVAVWETAAGSKYVDASGVSFTNNPMVEPIVTIKDESGLDVDSSAVTSSRFLNFVGQIIAGVNSDGTLRVESITIPLGAIRYIELRLVGYPYPIKTQIDREVTSQVSDIVNMVKYLSEKGITPNYVDVRVEHKGYYR